METPRLAAFMLITNSCPDQAVNFTHKVSDLSVVEIIFLWINNAPFSKAIVFNNSKCTLPSTISPNVSYLAISFSLHFSLLESNQVTFLKNVGTISLIFLIFVLCTDIYFVQKTWKFGIWPFFYIMWIKNGAEICICTMGM